MAKTFYQRHKNAFSLFDGLFLGNTILERGLVLAPVIVASYNYRNSLVLGLSFMIITFSTVLISSFITKKIPYTIRTILYSLIACAIFIPTAMLMNHYWSETVFTLGVFLPLLVANSLIVVKSESRFHKRKMFYMVIDLLCHCIGFFLVIMLVGVIRELFGNGMFFNIPVANMPKVSVIQFPFAGFIIVGFLAAIVKRVKYKLDTKVAKEKK